MAKAVRRQSAQQRVATIFGGAIVLILLVVLLASVIQGSRRPATESAMQRVMSARVVPHHFISDKAWVEGDTVYVVGHFGGIPSEVPNSDAAWQALAKNVADVYAKDLSGVANSVSVDFYHFDQLMVTVVEQVK